MSTKSQTTDEETSVETESKSDVDVSTSQSLQNLTDCLHFWQSVDINTDQKDIFVFFSQYKDLINDYHHVLSNHLNRDHQTLEEKNKSFESIHKYISEHVKCDSINNVIHIRNNRHREDDDHQNNDPLLSFYVDIMDTIHCLFLHSYHYNIRALQTNKNQQQHKMVKTFSFKHTETKKLKEQMKQTRNNLQSLRGDIRFDHNRFCTKLSGLVSFKLCNQTM